MSPEPDEIMRKTAGNHPLCPSGKCFSKMISKCHFRIEQRFGVMKQWPGLYHTPDTLGWIKLMPNWMLAAIGQTSLKAVNKTILRSKTPAIAWFKLPESV